jgi:hypothetical protein
MSEQSDQQPPEQSPEQSPEQPLEQHAEHPAGRAQPQTSSESSEDLSSVIARAFDYRGDVTVVSVQGETIEGYIFDRRDTGPQPQIRMMLPDGQRKAIAYEDIAQIRFTGRDTAAGKSWETWVKKYHEKKAKGEKASMEPEPLE